MINNLLEKQSEKRQQYLDTVLASPNPRKLIVAGPGTGKTHTFGQLFRNSARNDNLALTFIKNLVDDMNNEFGDVAEVKTFHAYCKKILHKRYGSIELVPFLTQLIEEDANFLGYEYSKFNSAFQNLDENSDEICFYLDRGDYYRAVSFDDSVFRVYKAVKENEYVLPKYNQIVIDEFQDFNPLEIAFINELQRNSPILIVGDDDQAVFSLRNSSPDFLREKMYSGEYEIFELPFCSRCPRIVVEATTVFVEAAIKRGNFVSRISRPFVPCLEDKDYENQAYPKIISATTSNIACQSKLIQIGIENIPEGDIREAYQESYPCALIVGKRQFLNPLYKSLKKYYSNIAFKQAERRGYSILDGYNFLLKQADSNLGWRILASCVLSDRTLREVVHSSQDGSPINSLIPQEFVDKHSMVIEKLGKEELSGDDQITLQKLLGDQFQVVIDHFFPAKEDEEEPDPDHSKPSILLSSFEGCKGLSAGHVFVVGLNEGIMPKIYSNGYFHDIECCKFIVAMTRTRKLLYLLSNRWDYGPQGHRFNRSIFFSMIHPELKRDGGYVKIKDVEDFLMNTQES